MGSRARWIIYITILLTLFAGETSSPAFLPLEEWSKEKESSITLTNLEMAKDPYVEKVLIHTTGYVEPQETYTSSPPAIILDFPAAALKKELSALPKISKRIKRAYTRPHPELKNQLQVVIELLKEEDFEVVNVFGRNLTYVEIFDLKKPPPPPAVTNPLEGKLIAIDPGHGGEDTGALSTAKRYEKEYCLETALKLAETLKKQGARVYLTRSKNQNTNYREFIPEINRADADLFIGIHYNSFEDRSVKGTETFYFTKESKPLARYVQASLFSALGTRDRGIRKNMHYVTHHAKMPAIIVEPLYLTNSEEERLARSPKTQSKIALAIASGIKNYLRDYGTD